jgi:hypothetical protein
MAASPVSDLPQRADAFEQIGHDLEHGSRKRSNLQTILANCSRWVFRGELCRGRAAAPRCAEGKDKSKNSRCVEKSHRDERPREDSRGWEPTEGGLRSRFKGVFGEVRRKVRSDPGESSKDNQGAIDSN